jgi:hypothetical protein
MVSANSEIFLQYFEFFVAKLIQAQLGARQPVLVSVSLNIDSD